MSHGHKDGGWMNADQLESVEGAKPDLPSDRMLKWFDWQHLPTHLQLVSSPFCDLANKIVENIEPGPERTIALRKLLEAKDATVRAVVHPGG